MCLSCLFFFFSSRRRHTRFDCDWSSDVCSSDLDGVGRKHLEGKLATETVIPSSIHFRHSAPTERSANLVRAELKTWSEHRPLVRAGRSYPKKETGQVGAPTPPVSRFAPPRGIGDPHDVRPRGS